MSEVARFHEWATTTPPERRRGEWECDYPWWSELYSAVLGFVDAVPFANWSTDEVAAVLFAVARDNEMEHLASEICSRQPDTLVALAQAAVESGERDAKWQLAEQLGQLAHGGGQAEPILVTLACDEEEYVRRRSLKSLARLGSPAVEKLALAEWQRADENQDYARMMVLWCLHRIGSPHLAPLLEMAAQDMRMYLSKCAERIQRGEVDA